MKDLDEWNSQAALNNSSLGIWTTVYANRAIVTGACCVPTLSEESLVSRETKFPTVRFLAADVIGIRRATITRYQRRPVDVARPGARKLPGATIV